MRLSELQALTPKLQVIAERYGASNIAVFGSVARDEATEASDVDLLVDLPPGTSLFLITQITPRAAARSPSLVHMHQLAHGTQRHSVPERSLAA